jgi:hypothetical protein
MAARKLLSACAPADERCTTLAADDARGGRIDQRQARLATDRGRDERGRARVERLGQQRGRIIWMPAHDVDQVDRVQRLEQSCAAAGILRSLSGDPFQHRQRIETLRELDVALNELASTHHDWIRLVHDTMLLWHGNDSVLLGIDLAVITTKPRERPLNVRRMAGPHHAVRRPALECARPAEMTGSC